MYAVIITANNTYGTDTCTITVTVAPGSVLVRFYNAPFGLWANRGDPLTVGVVGSGPPAKICADGSQATRIHLTSEVITAASIGDLDVELVGAVDPGQEGLYLGSLSTPTYSPEAGGAVITLTHPRLVKSSGQSFPIGLRISFDGEELGTYPIDIYRAPVLMVHGLWGEASVFSAMESELEAAGWQSALAARFGYADTHADHFNDNVDRLRNGIFYNLTRVVRAGFSAGQTDVVAHSMGGILARLHHQRMEYQTDRAKIYRLITLNTPHAGSQAADFIMEHEFVQNMLNRFKRPTGNGAVEDLQVDSSAIDSLLNGPSRANNPIPSHAVYTWGDTHDLEGWPSLLVRIAAFVANVDEDEFIQNLYGEPNDVIVPQRSQWGGLSGTQLSFVDNQIHVGSPGNGEVIDSVRTLLATDPQSNRFAHNGFDPEDLTYPAGRFMSPQSVVGGVEVSITAPAVGTVVEPGESIQVAVTGDPSVERIFVGAGNATAPAFSITQTGSTASVEYVVPVEAIGRVNIVAAGAAGTEFGTDSVYVMVVPTVGLDSISVYPDDLIVSVDASSGLEITGHFADGIARNLTGFPGIVYEVSDSGIATITDTGEVVGVSEGTTTGSVSYAGQSATLQIRVLPALPPVRNEDGRPESAVPTTTSLLSIYPNPVKTSVTVQYQTPSPQRVSIRVYDLLGRIVSTPVEREVGVGTHEARVDVTGLASGTYIIQLEADAYRQAQVITVMH